MRRLLISLVAAVTLVALPVPAYAGGGSPLRTYAADTWRSMVAMTDSRSPIASRLSVMNAIPSGLTSTIRTSNSGSSCGTLE